MGTMTVVVLVQQQPVRGRDTASISTCVACQKAVSSGYWFSYWSPEQDPVYNCTLQTVRPRYRPATYE